MALSPQPVRSARLQVVWVGTELNCWIPRAGAWRAGEPFGGWGNPMHLVSECSFCNDGTEAQLQPMTFDVLSRGVNLSFHNHR